MKTMYVACASVAMSLFAGCVADGDGLSTNDQSVINGVLIDPSLIRSRGLVRVGDIHGDICSGVLLSNDMALTAGHCLGFNPPTGWNEYYVAFDGDDRTVTRQYRFGGGDEPAANGPDFALLQFDPFEILGSTSGFGHPIEPSTDAELTGRDLQIYGKGLNSNTSAYGTGQWQVGQVRVLLPNTDPYADDITYWDGGSGQMIAPGDSGGPSFLEDEDGPRLVGIHSAGSAPGTCAPTDNCIGFDQLIYPDFWGLVGTMDPPWNMYDGISVFDVWRAELRVARLYDADIETAHWTLTAHNVNRLARNRYQLSAHITGFETADKLGFAPSSDLYAVVHDIDTAVIANAGVDAFYDLHETEWAQAQRVAMSACGQIGGGVSGYFTGNQHRGSSYELVCFRGGVINRTATYAELEGLGYRMQGVVQTPYAEAMRAAHSWCQSRGYISGYFTGRQTRTNYGITCQHL